MRVLSVVLAILFLVVTAPLQIIAFLFAPRKYIARFKAGYKAGMK